MDLMEYKGYTATVEVDLDAGLLYGYVLGLQGGIDFQAASIADVRREFEASVEDYLAWCREDGREPEKPFAGKITLRVEPTLHREVALRAAREGMRLEDWLQAGIRERLTHSSLTPPKSLARPTRVKRRLVTA